MRAEPRVARTADRGAVASARCDRLAREQGLTAEEWRGFVLVSSASNHLRRYVVDAFPVHSGSLVFECDHPIAIGFSSAPATSLPGRVSCKHMAAAADLMEAEGRARWDGESWRAA